MEYSSYFYIKNRTILLPNEQPKLKLQDYMNAMITIVKFLTKLGIYLIPFAIVWLYIAALVHQAHSLWP